MAGWLTPGLPPVGAVQNNGTAQAAPLGIFTNLNSKASLIPVDSEIAAGQPPQTVAGSAFQIACAAMAMIKNAGTSTAHTVTSNVVSGCVETEALTTAAGATYTFQIVDSLVAATNAIPQVQMHSGTNSAGDIQVTNITNGTGTCTAVFTNTGTAAWNGTMIIGWHL